MVLAHGGLFNRAVYAFDLAVAPGVAGLGDALLKVVLGAEVVEDVTKSPRLVTQLAELDTVVGQHRVHPVGQLSQSPAQELRASILVACGCNSAKATLLMRSMATNK